VLRAGQYIVSRLDDVIDEPVCTRLVSAEPAITP
jgi:hypothetical protein